MANFIGSSGDDIFTGGPDDDTATGNGGNDQLSGAGGRDDLSGDAGADTLDGGDGDDILYASQRSPPFNQPGGSTVHVPPVLDTGAEVDTLRGGAGNDMIFAGYGDNVDGGANDSRLDRLYLSLQGATSGVTADFRQANVVIGGGTITGIEQIMWLDGSQFDDDINLETNSGNFWGNESAAFGLGGNDRLVGGQFTFRLYGGDGDDVLDARANISNTYLEGGAGNDTLYGGNGEAFGGDGDDTIYCKGNSYGGAGNDLIVVQPGGVLVVGPGGGLGTPWFYGEDGNDEIRAVATGSHLSGGNGADLLVGNAGNDTLYSAGLVANTPNPADDMGLERDLIWGGDGNDKIAAGYGDSVDGSNGTDTLSLSFGGASGGVTFDSARLVAGLAFTIGGGTIQNIETLVSVRGSDFADRLSFVTQATLLTVNAGDGDDEISWGMSSVSVNGGNGNDRFINGAAGDILDGGAGIDTIDYRNATAGVTLALAEAGQTTTGPGGDQLKYIENVDGSAYSDTLSGDHGANVLRGMAGNDIINGRGGDDVLDGGTGADGMSGGSGNDWYFVDQADDVIVEGTGVGDDRVFASVSYALAADVEVETLTTTANAGTAAIDLTGNGIANFIYGNDGANTLRGGGGNDTLASRAGNDVLDGGTGLDTMIGGTGDDWYFVDQAGDVVGENAGEGADRVFTSASYALAANAEVETLTTTANDGTVAIDLTGSNSANFIYGNDGVNTLRGGAGDDFLASRAGNDWLDGGTGNDTLNGAGGADTFAFTTALGAGNVDTIVDFAAGVDRIALDDAVFTGLAVGALPAGAFVVGTAAQDADDRIVYDQATGKLYFDADGNGAGAAVQFATLQGHPAITAADFVVI